jgi:hypothetical protein
VDRAAAAVDVCVHRLTRQGHRLAAAGAPPVPIRVVQGKG